MNTDKDLELEKKTAYDQALEAMSAPKPTYAGTFDQQLSDIYDKIVNRDKFSYDAGKDPMYQMSKDRYTQLGKLAMKDSMGQASALTGGYGSTYGQQVGQQAYDAQLQGLNDVVPELYQMAYGMYSDEGDKLQNQYAMIGQQQSDEYAKYRDALGDYNVEQADAYGKAMDEASLMAQYGDFSGFSKLYGEEKGKLMAETWYQQNPDLALKLGLIDKAKYKEIKGSGTQVNSGYIYSTKDTEKNTEADSPVKKGSYNFGELMDAAAGGMSKSQIEQQLSIRGVDTSKAAVQADINKALSK